MIIYRRKNNGKLYTIAYVRPPKMTGSWFEAVPYKWQGKKLTLSHDYGDKFEAVAEGAYHPNPTYTNE